MLVIVLKKKNLYELGVLYRKIKLNKNLVYYFVMLKILVKCK